MEGIYKGSYNEYFAPTDTINQQDYFSFRLNSFLYAPVFKKKLHVFAFINFNGVDVNAQSKTYSTPIYGFGAQKKHKNHTFGLVYVLPFNREITINKTITDTKTLYSKTTNDFDVSYYIQVSYAYNFSKGKSIKKMNRESEVESDTKSGGIGR